MTNLKAISKIVAATTMLAVLPAMSSCTNFRSSEANAAATGGLIGAGAGAVLSDNPLGGAAVGGALGAGAGYLIDKTRR